MTQNLGNALQELLVLNRAVKSVCELSPSSTKPRERSPRAPGPKPNGEKCSSTPDRYQEKSNKFEAKKGGGE
ncbi:hypothetical protein LR48_Vigan03g226700 [Vigna angularis]|uniref:Uncharacterized protein n=1 Tax=Phaseolus angularis TaxID=3914 RepID=A0A0L9U7T4_PHAAN|nr:hypothetical protein LR48_Vigan03g226700 [Vigna angularis]